ncbi:hypothetical protein DFS34DRAFT_324616 [Phlyctochytrium arcticum]|nr:hypothetical protein DFS34DRAFT_324616 [Phlyctochytrium arcticum]
MRETLQREEMRFKQVKLEKEKMERKLRDVELEISNLSLKCDAILSGTLESLNDWDQKLYSPEPDKRQFWCQYGQEIEEVSAQEDELLRYWKAKHSDLFTEGATEMQHPLLPNEPFPEKISERRSLQSRICAEWCWCVISLSVQFQIPDHLQREMKRLRTVMPLARKELLDSELQQLYTKLKAGSTVPDGDTRSQSGINDSAIPQHVAENGHDCSDLQEELNRLCEIDLPRIWNETAEYEVRLPIVEEYTKAIENDFTRLVETSQLLEKEMSEQGARREILESALRVESEYLRERNVTEVALLQLLKERDTTVKAIHHGATNGMQSAQHHTPDEAARIVMKAMAKILDLPADQGLFLCLL